VVGNNGASMVDRVVHPANASIEILSSKFGRRIHSRLVHPLNANLPILVIEFDRFIVLR